MSLTGAHRNDVTQLLPLLDKIPPVRGRRGRPRRRPDRLYADRGYDHDSYRRKVHIKGIEPVHQKATLGIGGRRILVSRDWSGKTLADHRADAKAWVRALLGVSTDHEHHDQVDAVPGTPALVAWELARPDDPDLAPLEHRLLRAISQRIQWRAELNAARQRAGLGPPGNVSATAPNHPTRKEVPQWTTKSC